MGYITQPFTVEFDPLPVLGGKGYYLQLIGTNTSRDNPWVVPEGHSVIGREGSYLIVRIDKEHDGLEDGAGSSSGEAPGPDLGTVEDRS